MGERWSLAGVTTALVTCGSKGMGDLQAGLKVDWRQMTTNFEGRIQGWSKKPTIFFIIQMKGEKQEKGRGQRVRALWQGFGCG
jgi:hypothetical protein